MNCSIAFEKLIIRKAFYFRRFGKDREMFVGAEFHTRNVMMLDFQ